MWGIASRNFLLQGHRYRVLLIALVLGGVVFTLLFGVGASLTKTVREKAARYFSGDVVVLAVERKNDFVLDDPGAVQSAILSSQVDWQDWHRRSLYYAGDAQLFFDGSSLIQRRVVGVDFSVEAEAFRNLDFADGVGPSAEGSANGVWISDDTARRLRLKVGQAVILLLSTVQGYRNTVNLEVAGIFADSSLFGFACYLDFRVLNRALGRPEGSLTEIGLTLAPGQDEAAAAAAIHRSLSGKVPLAPLTATKEALEQWSKTNKKMPKSYGVLTLAGRMEQIRDLIESIRLVNLLLTAVFLVVVSIGVYNTYQMIVFERTKEIGTMRALGMQRTGVVVLFLSESLILGFLGALGGLLLGTLALWGLGLLDFSGNLLAEMFLVKGRLAWAWPLDSVLGVVAVMVATSLFGALVPSLRGARQKPVDALRQE